jgi:hypothetical protein
MRHEHASAAIAHQAQGIQRITAQHSTAQASAYTKLAAQLPMSPLGKGLHAMTSLQSCGLEGA